MPNEYWNAVFSAPVPFFLSVVLAVVAVATVIWRAMLWRYKAVNEKQTELYDLLNKKAQLEANVAAGAENELKKTIASLTEQIEALKASESLQPPFAETAGLTEQMEALKANWDRVQAKFARLEETSTIATRQLETLSSANNAVSATLSSSSALIARPFVMSQPLGSPRVLLNKETTERSD